MAEAFARDAASQTPTTSAQPDGATTPPAETPETTSATPPSTEQGPIPFTVHKTALDNARSKAVEEFRQTSGVDQAVALANKINTNPAGFLAEYARELLSNPQHAAATKAELARMFGGLRQQAPKPAPQIDLNPDMQVVDNDGRVVGATFSAEKVKALLKQTVDQAVAPLTAAEQQRKTEAAAVKAKAEAAATKQRLDKAADDVLSEVRDTLELREDTPKEQADRLFVEVNKLMAANPGMSAHRAALQVRQTHVVPSLAGKAQADVLKDLQTKANAQAVNPAGAVVAAANRPKSFLDKSLKW